jgi:sugar lactone lactonase YvrE
MRTIRTTTTIGLFLAALAGAAALGACSDDGGGSSGKPSADAGDAATTDAPSGGGDAGDAATRPDADAPVLSVAHGFDPTKFELAEGLALRNGSAYVTLAPLGAIVKVDPDGKAAPYASVPPGYDDGYTLGLAFDGDGNLFVAQTKNSDTATVLPGVYKIAKDTDGGTVGAPFATHPQMVFPNGLAFLSNGRLLVTDSATGQIFVVDPSSGAAATWKNDPALDGSPACPAPLPFPIGANGIVLSGGDVFVTNTARGALVRIPVNADGSAGAAAIVVEDCKYVGLDGIARDADGAFLVAQNGAPGKLLRIAPGGAVTTLAEAKPLDGPGSVAVAESWKGKKTALLTNTAFFSIGQDGGAPSPSLATLAPLP